MKQVDADPNQLETLASGKVVAKENGYVYVYTSNESQQDVLFDNMGVTDITGPVLEETHYYPFGLTMAGISTTAPLKLENRFKFNGKELNHKEFSDGAGLEWYSYGQREFDPQIGRFFRIDPISDSFPHLTPYQYAGNEPLKNIDIDGLEQGNVNNVYVKALMDNQLQNQLTAASNYATNAAAFSVSVGLGIGMKAQIGQVGFGFDFGAANIQATFRPDGSTDLLGNVLTAKGNASYGAGNINLGDLSVASGDLAFDRGGSPSFMGEVMGINGPSLPQVSKKVSDGKNFGMKESISGSLDGTATWSAQFGVIGLKIKANTIDMGKAAVNYINSLKKYIDNVFTIETHPQQDVPDNYQNK